VECAVQRFRNVEACVRVHLLGFPWRRPPMYQIQMLFLRDYAVAPVLQGPPWLSVAQASASPSDINAVPPWLRSSSSSAGSAVALWGSESNILYHWANQLLHSPSFQTSGQILVDPRLQAKQNYVAPKNLVFWDVFTAITVTNISLSNTLCGCS
jgi:hypothetical protein